MALEFDTAKGDDLETVRQRLAEAAAWFEAASPLPGSGFPRNPILHPSHLETDRKHAVWSVAAARTRPRGDKVALVGPIGGRLLGYAPDETVSDGASQDVTSGFFDVEDEPPWDLWLGWMVEKSGREYLVSWISPVLVHTVENGIDVNPVECIFWLPELEQALDLTLSG